MISEAEIRRIAAAAKVDPMVIDLDYCLGWFLLGLQNTSASFEGLIFKGGTCLRKCYFSDYRFSEDLTSLRRSIYHSLMWKNGLRGALIGYVIMMVLISAFNRFSHR
jgi:hypothetical protein